MRRSHILLGLAVVQALALAACIEDWSSGSTSSSTSAQSSSGAGGNGAGAHAASGSSSSGELGDCPRDLPDGACFVTNTRCEYPVRANEPRQEEHVVVECNDAGVWAPLVNAVNEPALPACGDAGCSAPGPCQDENNRLCACCYLGGLFFTCETIAPTHAGTKCPTVYPDVGKPCDQDGGTCDYTFCLDGGPTCGEVQQQRVVRTCRNGVWTGTIGAPTCNTGS